MTINKYFTLTTSDSSLSKKFRVVEGGYSIVWDKKQDDQPTLDGVPDITQGGIYQTYNFSVKVYQEDPDNTIGDPQWGTLADLQTFYNYNNPNAASGPSDIITMIDHYGNTNLVVFMGQLNLQPATIMLEGINAVYFIPIMLRKVG